MAMVEILAQPKKDWQSLTQTMGPSRWRSSIEMNIFRWFSKQRIGIFWNRYPQNVGTTWMATFSSTDRCVYYCDCYCYYYYCCYDYTYHYCSDYCSHTIYTRYTIWCNMHILYYTISHSHLCP
jgi:hypothetical protein